jgi:pimeloyl-ACP methyl ester carboxylesterase
MSVLGPVLITLAIVVVLFQLLALRYRSDRRADEIHTVVTKDGWPLAVHRYLPRGPKKNLRPVILCHGLGANRFNFDLNDKYSYALHLAKQGYDVFIPEVRGVGQSARKPWFYPGKWDISFEHFVEQDAPAIIEHVRKLSNRKKPHWVGHSMGGMIAYAFAQGETGKQVHSFCSIAGPGDPKYFEPMKSAVSLAFLLKPFPVIHQNFFARMLAVLLEFLSDMPGGGYIYQRDQMETSTLKSAGANLVTDTPTRLLFDFVRWVKNGRWTRTDGYAYQDHYDRIKTPFLFLSGEKDFFVPYGSIRKVYDEVSSTDKKHVHFSEANGTVDYGHGDILLGISAPEHVWPVIDNWIGEHA